MPTHPTRPSFWAMGRPAAERFRLETNENERPPLQCDFLRSRAYVCRSFNGRCVLHSSPGPRAQSTLQTLPHKQRRTKHLFTLTTTAKTADAIAIFGTLFPVQQTTHFASKEPISVSLSQPPYFLPLCLCIATPTLTLHSRRLAVRLLCLLYLHVHYLFMLHYFFMLFGLIA